MSKQLSVHDFQAIIANFTPRSVPGNVWPEIEDFVREAVCDLDLRPDTSSRDKLRTTLGAVARLVAWVYVQYGVATREGVFHHQVIMDYFQSGPGAGLTKRAAGAQRSLLFRVGAELNPEWSRELEWGLTYEPALEPYSEHEMHTSTRGRRASRQRPASAAANSFSRSPSGRGFGPARLPGCVPVT